MEVKDIIAKGRPSASVAHLPEFRYIWGVHDGYEYALEEFESNRLKACDAQTEAEAERELNFAIKFFEEHHRQLTFSDAIEITRKQIIDKAVKYFSGLTRCAVSCIGEDVNVPILNKEQLEDFKKAMEE